MRGRSELADALTARAAAGADCALIRFQDDYGWSISATVGPDDSHRVRQDFMRMAHALRTHFGDSVRLLRHCPDKNQRGDIFPWREDRGL